MEFKDKNYLPILVNDRVLTPDPTDEDGYNHSFEGTVKELGTDGYVIVEDGDGDCWCIEPERLEVLNP